MTDLASRLESACRSLYADQFTGHAPVILEACEALRTSERDLTYVQRERDQAVMRWQIAEERVKRLEAAMDAISSTDPIDAALDPQRAIYIARVVLSESRPESTPAKP